MRGTKNLIAYFSREGNNYVSGGIVNLPVGNTEAAANMIQKLTGSDMFRIQTVKDYPSDYNETTDVAKQELRQNARPKLSGHVDNVDEYAVIILGYPNWWGTMPMAVLTFLEEYDFSGRTIIPFCTNEGSGLGRSESDIKQACPDAKVLKGLSIRGGSVQKAENDISAWLRKSGIVDSKKLFPNHTSTLEVTDPELIEVFDNFAFDEVLSHGGLDDRSRLMLILATLIASQTLSEYKVMLGGALNIGVTPVEAKEIVYQAVPYCGIARVFDFIHATNEVLETRGVKLPLEGQSTTSPETRYEKGLALQKAIFGEMIEKMHAESPRDQIHIQKYLTDNCFGDYYTRKGLDIRTRELLTFSMILSLGGCESQLKAHIQGNANIGNGKETLLNVVTQLLPYVGYPRALNAIRCINEVMPA